MVASLAWTAGRVSVPLFVQQGLDKGVREDGPLLRWSLLIGRGTRSTEAPSRKLTTARAEEKSEPVASANWRV